MKAPLPLSIPYVEDKRGCWLCSIGEDKSGYRRIMRKGKRVMAHRQAWIEARGPIPEGLKVLHECDVRRCIRPAHLFLGTQLDNIEDMRAKGRMAVGTGMKHAKLDDDKVRAIRADQRTHAEIAADYGVTVSKVGKVKRREKWRHVE